MLAGLMVSAGLAETVLRPDCKNAIFFKKLIKKEERRGLESSRQHHDSRFRRAVGRITRRQILAFFLPAAETDEAIVYAWCTERSRYIGKAVLQRKAGRGRKGPVWRIQEHMAGTYGHREQERGVTKYRMARRAEAFSHTFLAARIGPARRMEGMELYAINTLKPPANGKKQNKNAKRGKRSSRQRVGPGTRRLRYVRCFNAATKELEGFFHKDSPLDTVEAKEFCDRYQEKNETAKKKRQEKEKESWDCDYSEAYRRLQRRKRKSGPVDIYSTERKRLFVLWCTPCNARLL